MEQLLEFLSKLLSVDDWPPRWFCGYWSDFHGWLYIGSDLVIWLAYFIIPVIIIYFIQRSKQINFVPIFWLFGAFIVLCGTTHLIDAAIFWWPAYRLSAAVKCVTAIVSFCTVIALIRELPKALSIQFNFDGQEHDHTEDLLQKDKRIAELELELADLKASI